MSFFTREHKKLALSTDAGSLMEGYRLSERRLECAAAHGDKRELKKAMAEHGKYEYAQLFQQTPEFKRKISKRRKAK